MARTNVLLEKSLAACISGIEMYNKPDFRYREEIFAILMINSWELLLKAKIMKDNHNKPDSIFIRSPKILANGAKSTKQTTLKTSRSGNPLSVKLLSALDTVAKNGNGVTKKLPDGVYTIHTSRGD